MSYLNNPNLRYNKSVGFDENGNPIEADMIDVASTMMPSWNTGSSINLKITQLTGGITNKLYLIKNNTMNGPDNCIIVRLYGDGTDMIIDRNVENSVFSQLSLLKFGPSFLGLFENGRVEQFISGSTALTEEQMSSNELCSSIAASVAGLHAQPIKLDNMNEVLFPTLFKFCDICEEQERNQHDGKFVGAKDSENAPNMVTNLAWMSEAVRSKKLRREVEWMKSYLESFAPGAAAAVTVFSATATAGGATEEYWQNVGRQIAYELVFCHNDLLCGNVLLGTTSDASALTLIDYEYAGYNRAAYDIANHFDEYAGVDIYNSDSHKKCWPTKEHRMNFMRSYLLARISHYLASGVHNELLEVCAKMTDNKEIFDHICSGLDGIVCKYSMAAHMLWGVWGLIQCSMSSIDFDYLGFAKWRIMDGYYYHKKLQTGQGSV